MSAWLLGAAAALAVWLWPGGWGAHLARTAIDSRLVDTSSARAGRRARPVWWRRWWRALRGSRVVGGPTDEAVLALLDGLAPAVREGLAPAAALELVARTRSSGDWRWLRPVARAAAAGHQLSGPWAEIAAEHDSRALRHLARAWALSDSLGAPLADALATTAATVRADRDRARRLQAATAGPRATVLVLTCLPILGLGLAATMGFSPVDLYVRSLLGAASLCGGLLLLLLGRRIVAALIARSVRGEVVA